MQVHYRGISYELKPPAIESTETEQTTLFLGNSCKIRQYSVKQPHLAPAQLKYRGVGYRP
ncbi:MAG TPA: DUF4278 domain-containing protein [Coleofasciculaceae cyanobacterium]